MPRRLPDPAPPAGPAPGRTTKGRMRPVRFWSQSLRSIIRPWRGSPRKFHHSLVAMSHMTYEENCEVS